MKNCEQTAGQSILDHGLSVWQQLKRLLEGDTSGMRLPQWYTLYRDQLISTAHPAWILERYAIYHDCGKPFCLEIDADGKRHFPNHAAISEQTWREHFADEPSSEKIAELIGLDMIMHTESFDEILKRNLSDRTTSSLLLSALAELHSNAQMFGGIESTSFKIKWKRLDKLGMKLAKRMFDHSYMYIITRKDLSIPQQAVQATHAAIEAARAYLTPDCEHPSLVYCGEKNEGKLIKLRDHFKSNGIRFKEFYEPDIGHQLTALATAPTSGADRAAFRKLQLIK